MSYLLFLLSPVRVVLLLEMFYLGLELETPSSRQFHLPPHLLQLRRGQEQRTTHTQHSINMRDWTFIWTF